MTELNMNDSGGKLQIVVVEGHGEYLEALTEFLEKEGHHVLSFESSEHFGDSHLPESIDLNLPSEDQVVLKQRQLQGSSGEVMRTNTETWLFRGLARAPGRRMTSEQLILAIGKTVWAYPKHTLEAAMARLRKKLFEAQVIA